MIRELSFTGPRGDELTKAWYYDHYLGATICEPYAKEVSIRLECSKDVRVVLEIAAGTGRATAHIRKLIPSEAMLIASDIDSEMLTIAQQNLVNEKIDWRIIDAHKLPFLNNSIDIIVCCFGFMFTDVDLSFREAYRVLKPGGKLIFTTWDGLNFNPVQRIFREVVSDFFQRPLDQKYLKPFSLSDDSLIRAKLSLSRFTSVTIESIKKTIDMQQIKALVTGMINGSSLSEEILSRCPERISEIEYSVIKRVERKGLRTLEASVRALICRARK